MIKLKKKQEYQNIAELYKRANNLSNESEMKGIEIIRPSIYKTHKEKTIHSLCWTEYHCGKRTWNGPNHVKLVFNTQNAEESLIKDRGLKEKVTRDTFSNPNSNCYHQALTHGIGSGWATVDMVETALRDGDCYPIAGGSRNGNHPNLGWSGKEGYHSITSSGDDPIIKLDSSSGERSQKPQKGDIIVYWAKDTAKMDTAKNKWSMTHAATVESITEAEGEDGIYAKSKWGLQMGCYKHRPFDVPLEYGEAYTIYHSDTHEGPLLQAISLEEPDRMSPLRDNNFHVIASSDNKSATTSEQPREGDIVVYWIQHPDTQVWSPLYRGDISHHKKGEIAVRGK